jgi:hypothetical protein
MRDAIYSEPSFSYVRTDEAMLNDQGNGSRNSYPAGRPSASDKSHLQRCELPAGTFPSKIWPNREVLPWILGRFRVGFTVKNVRRH